MTEAMSPDARLGVLVSGNGSNLQALLDASYLAPIEVVISNRPDAFALTRAQRAGIKTVVLDHQAFLSRDAFDEALVKELKTARVSWVVLAGFMRIIGKPMLEAYAGRILNIHPSLLPAFPGLHAQRQALKAGVRMSGCTVHLVDTGVDTGTILAQAAVPVLPDDTEESLTKRILIREHQLLPAVVRAVTTGQLERDAETQKLVLRGSLAVDDPTIGACAMSPFAKRVSDDTPC